MKEQELDTGPNRNSQFEGEKEPIKQHLLDIAHLHQLFSGLVSHDVSKNENKYTTPSPRLLNV